MMPDPIRDVLERQGFIVLDGGLATELETLGCDLNDPLWSARALVDERDAIRAAHRRFLEAGADCIATATYQATIEGFAERGLDGAELLRTAVALAVEARDDFWSAHSSAAPAQSAGLPASPADLLAARRPRPLVAASVGPYGAMLADGSEYRGDYGLLAAELYDFHAPRWEVLAESDADLLACETTPALPEAEAYCRLAAVSHRPTWISFQCRDGGHLADGTPLADAVALCDAEPHVVAVGVNCVSPRLVPALIREAQGATDKPILVYPNAGEAWDATAKRWAGSETELDWARSVREWREAGASGIGGCCRIGPDRIARIRRELGREEANVA